MTKISLVTAYYKNELMTQDFLKNIADKIPEDTEVILVNAGSEQIRNPIVTKYVHLDKNESFSNSFNAGLREATGDYICIINNDAFPEAPGWLEHLIELLSDEAWLASPQNNLASISNYRAVSETPEAYTVEFYPAVCWMMTKETFSKIGFFDERYKVGNYEDNDYCKRLEKLSGTLVVSKSLSIKHLGSQTVNLFDSVAVSLENYEKFVDKWQNV
jgi:GT2 family glycosyltransferase